MTREFDLNIERVLENWAVAHALREIIANAIDEQALTGSRDPEIFADSDGCWHIRDWGRGVRYEHLTQNENQEKLANPSKVVGKFGVGLKDALATFDRHDITVTIKTRHGDITTSKQAKHGFADIQTLHALISEPSDPGFSGTEFILCGDALGEQEIQEAKALFLRYAGDQVLGSTTFGSVLKPTEKAARARIYVNGLRVAEEDNFLFSYNITSPTAALRRALNRERSNVGRGAYTGRVKDILLACDADHVVDELIADLQNYERGSQHDETQWLDVGLHACRQLNARRQVIFLTAFELTLAPDFVQRARDDGCQVIVVPESIRVKLRGLRDPLGNPMRDLERYRDEWQDSFAFTFINREDMTTAESRIWETLPAIFATRGGRPAQVKDIRVSETMRLMEGRYQEAAGLWDQAEGKIIVKRTQLQSLAAFAGTVLHEVSHALSRAPDVSLEFEQALTDELGAIVARQLDSTTRASNHHG